MHVLLRHPTSCFLYSPSCGTRISRSTRYIHIWLRIKRGSVWELDIGDALTAIKGSVCKHNCTRIACCRSNWKIEPFFCICKIFQHQTSLTGGLYALCVWYSHLLRSYIKNSFLQKRAVGYRDLHETGETNFCIVGGQVYKIVWLKKVIIN